MNTLDAIRGRAAFALSGHRDDALRGAEWDRAALLAAVDAVLGKHVPDDPVNAIRWACVDGVCGHDGEDGPERQITPCKECSHFGIDMPSYVQWPCPTVEAITEALADR